MPGRAPDPPPAHSRTRALVAAVASLALIALLAVRASTPRTAGATPREPSPARSSGLAPESVVEPPPPAQRLAPSGSSLPARDEHPALPPEVAAHLRTDTVALSELPRDYAGDDPGPGPYLARYQGRSGRLSPRARASDGEVETRLASAGGAPTLTAWVPSVRVQAGAGVTVRASLTDEAGAPLAPDAIGVYIVPRGARDDAAHTAPMQPAPPGAPHQFEYALAPSETTLAAGEVPVAVDYGVRARGTTRAGAAYERVVRGGFWVHRPGGHLLPETARVAPDEGTGDLRLTVDAVIERAGRYWAYAELWGGDDSAPRPIAFARERFDALAPGAHPVALAFGGRVVRDAAIDGPYVVRNVRFVQADGVPPQESEPITALPPTPAWRAAEFH